MEIREPQPETVTVRDVDYVLTGGVREGWTLYPCDEIEEVDGWMCIRINPNPITRRTSAEVHELQISHILKCSTREQVFIIPAKKPNVSQIRPTPPSSGHRPGSDEEPRKDIHIKEA